MMMKNNQKGFTLIEIAVSLIILGLLITPAISAYNLYQKNLKIDQTVRAVDQTSRALEGFLGAYGRYPCPAPRDAVPGDVEYGFESRDTVTGDCLHSASATPVAGVIAVASDPASPVSVADPADNLVVIGSVPFKTLNIQEEEIYDGYGTKLTYAMTELLADPDDYAPNLGGISIDKFDDGGGAAVSAIVPDHSAHYVVVSHGEEQIGGFTGAGVRTGTCAGALAEDQQNCNDDHVFFISEKSANFDDIVAFAGGEAVTPWQYQDGNTSNIHLKTGGERVVGGLVGNPASQTITNASAFDIRNTGYDEQLAADCSGLPFTSICLSHIADQTLRANCEANLSSPDCTAGYSAPSPSDLIVTVEAQVDTSGNPIPHTGGVVASEICEDIDASGNGIHCFDPVMIGGGDPGTEPVTFNIATPFTDVFAASGTAQEMIPSTDPRHPTGTGPDASAGGNLKCPSNQMMVGFRNGQILCASRTELDCPSGSVLSGISGSGELVCENTPPDPCPATPVTNSCGINVTLPATTHGSYEFSYSGQCYMMDTFDAATADTYTTLADLQTYIDGLNAAARTQQDCNLVRDRYNCTNGSFGDPPYRTHEKGNYDPDPTQPFRNPNNNSNAEALYYIDGGGNFVLSSSHVAYSVSVHPDNDNGNHDCWCREDYRVEVRADCSSGSGDVYYVQKKRCPATEEDDDEWVDIWNSGTTQCDCNVGDTFAASNVSCASALGVNNWQVDGNVTDTMQITNCSPYTTTLIGRNYGACTCPNDSDQIPYGSPTACPAGYGNSFTFDGENYTDVSYVRHRRFTCPSVSADGIIDSPSEVQTRVTIDHTEPCNCVGGVLSYRDVACPNNQLGVTRYETVLDCASGNYIDTGNILENCQSCEWTEPTAGSAQFSGPGNNPGGRILGTNCHCGSDTVGICKVPNGTGFDYWNDCTCDPAP